PRPTRFQPGVGCCRIWASSPSRSLRWRSRVVKKLEALFPTVVIPGAMPISPASLGVLERVVYQKSFSCRRRKKRDICCNEQHPCPLLLCDRLADGQGTRQVQRIVGPQRVSLQQGTGLRDDRRCDRRQCVGLHHMLQNLLRELLGFGSFQKA